MPYVSDTTRRCVRSLTSCARRSVPAVRSRASARRRFPRSGSRKNIAAAPASAASRNWNMAPLLSALLPAALRFTLAAARLVGGRGGDALRDLRAAASRQRALLDLLVLACAFLALHPTWRHMCTSSLRDF